MTNKAHHVHQEIENLEIRHRDDCMLLVAPILSVRSTLFPEEAAYIENSVEKRRREFSASRTLARYGMRFFGVSTQPILVGTMRQPLWPAGMIGSITHTETHCAVALGRSCDALSIGIDMETEGRVTRDLWPYIFTSEESAVLKALPAERQLKIAGYMFSAKEAYFKMQFPLTALLAGFTDVTTHMDNSGNMWVRPTSKIDSPLKICFLVQLISCGTELCTFVICKKNS